MNTNTQDKKCQDILAINSIFSSIMPNFFDQNGLLTRSPYEKGTFIPKTLRLLDPTPAEPHRRNGLALKLGFLQDILKERDLTDFELKQGLRICEQSRAYAGLFYSNGEKRFFEQMARGTARYAKKVGGKIKDFVSLMQRDNYESVFLTLTCDIKKYNNRCEAWRSYVENEVHPVTENLRKHHGAKYVGVVESTAKGWPHIHIILFFPKGEFTELSNYKNKQRVRSGKLFSYVKKHVPSKIFCLEKAEGDNLKWYLTKYLTKTVNRDIVELNHKSGKLKKSEIKELKGYLYLTIFQRREYMMSQLSKIKKEASEWHNEEAYEVSEHFCRSQTSEGKRSGEAKRSATALRSYLTSLCNNSPLRNPADIYNVRVRDFADTFGESLTEELTKQTDFSEKFKKIGRIVQYGQNFYSDFCELVVNPMNSPLNRKFYWNYAKDIYSLMSDGYDLDDDEEWCEFIFKVGEYFFKKCLSEGHQYKRVIDCLEENSFEPRIRIRPDATIEDSFDEPMEATFTWEETLQVHSGEWDYRT